MTFHTLKSGYMSTLNEQQAAAFTKFKEMIRDDAGLRGLVEHPHFDMNMLRFLRATMKHKKDKRVFQVDDALERLKQVTAWKEKYGISRDMEEPELFDVFEEVYPYYVWDDQIAKVPVAIERFGLLHSNSNRSRFTEDQWNLMIGYRMEQVLRSIDELSDEIGEEVPGYIVLADLKGVSLWGLLRRMRFIRMMNDVGAKNYPELLHKIVMINAPRSVNELMKAAKAVVDPDTMRKFESYRGHPPDIRETYELQHLPIEYSGDKEFTIPIPLDARKAS